MKAKLNETFYKRRSYTHRFDELAGTEFIVIEVCTDNSVTLQHPVTSFLTLKAERDEVDWITLQ